MNGAHLHLILNHLPVVGSLTCLALLAVGLASHETTIRKVGLWAAVITSLLALPAFLTGEPAEGVVEHTTGVGSQMIESHEDAAGWALGTMIAAGIAALAVLAFARKTTARTPVYVPLALTTLAFGLMLWTANLGGQIRHSEIRSAAVTTHDEHHD